MKRHYYLIADWTMRGKREYGKGFSNTKSALAFRSKAERAEWLRATHDMSAYACSRATALKMAKPLWGDRERYGIGVELWEAGAWEHDPSEVSYIKLKD